LGSSVPVPQPTIRSALRVTTEMIADSFMDFTRSLPRSWLTTEFDINRVLYV
jgi:hypothetical protein